MCNSRIKNEWKFSFLQNVPKIAAQESIANGNEDLSLYLIHVHFVLFPVTCIFNTDYDLSYIFISRYVKAEGVVPYWRWSWPWPCSKMQLQFGTCYWESYQQKYWWVPIHMKFYTICYKLKQMCNMGASILTMKTTLPRRSGVQTFCYLFLFSCEMFYENTIL